MTKFIERHKKGLKRVYKVLTVILCVYWAVFGGLLGYRQIQRTYFYPVKFSEEINKACHDYDLENKTVLAIINVESSFNKDAVSNKGAVGLMQLTDGTARFVADMRGIAVYDLKEPATNIDFGCYYLRYLVMKFEELETAVVAYNAGEGNVLRWLRDSRYSLDGRTLKEIPFEESRNYLEKYKNSYKKYNNLYHYIVDKT